MDSTLPSSQQRPQQQPVSQGSLSNSDTPVVKQTDEEKKKEEFQQVSAPNREFGPMSSSASPSESGGQVENDDDEDEIKVARQEVMLGQKVSPVKEVPISQELKEAGVEQGADTEKEIPVVVQRAGMRASNADSAIPVSASPSVKLPISYTHAMQLDKRSKIKESIKWLARFIKRQWERVQAMEKNQDKKVEQL